MLLILSAAFILRVFFFNGLVFSDDSYYNRLASLLLTENFTDNYLGYPIFLLRIGETFITSLFFFVLGENEISSVIFPFILSLSGIYLVYKFCLLYFRESRVAFVAAFLWAFFPVDIIFASINFTDLQCAFFINLGLYFLYKSYVTDKTILSVLAGAFFSVSFLFKENFVFVFLLLVVLLGYLVFATRKINRHITISLLVFTGFLILESIIYYFIRGNLGHRLTILHQNYIYCYYDFFPYTLLGTEYSSRQYFSALLKQVFILNPRYLFLRRYYLAVPFVAVLNSIILIKQRKDKLLVYWGLGIIILLMIMTTSFSDYKPFDLRRSWYIYIALLPLIMLAAGFIARFRKSILTLILILYSIAGIYMSREHQKFFDVDNLNEFKKYVKSQRSVLIYTDHHTKYGLDTIRGNKSKQNTLVVPGHFFSMRKISCGALVVVNKPVIDELKKQGYHYVSLEKISKTDFELLKQFGKFFIYRKN